MDDFKKITEQLFKIYINAESVNDLGLDNYFDAVSDGNNITKSKPDPEVFLKAADMLGVPYEKCLVVEDADSGIEAGKRAGMYTLAVNNAKGADYSLADLSAGKITDYIN